MFNPFGAHTMNANPLIVRDTKAWQLQVWVSFLLAVVLCATALAWLPGQELDRAFMVMGYFFCLSMAFVLSKFVRDQEAARRERRTADTPLFRLVVWAGFGLALGLTGWGLLRMNISETYKAFLAVGWLYLITTTFTLAKMLRDRHEADRAEARLAGRVRPAADSTPAAE
jgi:hypothetical protein